VRSSLALSLGMLVALLGGACTKPKSFVVLKLEAGTPIAFIASVQVDVKQSFADASDSPGLVATLTYPAPALTITDGHPADLSVSFSGGQSGIVTFKVTLFDTYGCTIGESEPTPGPIKQGNVMEVAVAISIRSGCARDAGARDAAGDTFPGCDPVTPQPQCSAAKTCQVNCKDGVAQCTTGGQGAPGSICAKNADCAPGSQCFDYASTGCGVKLCLRFCNDDNGCVTATADGGAPAGAGGAAVGTRALCQGPVPCGNMITGYHTCTFGCDPRATSVASSGCPAGLACLVVGDRDQVDCACAEKTRVGTDGASCVSSAQCAPGFICNLMSGARVCRALCRCNASGMTCTAPNDCTGGRGCSALTNDTLFGVCL
jgi:hypothetical protein